MTEKTKKILLGAFLFLILVFLLSWAHQTSIKDQKKNDFILYASFSKADGLNIGAPVRMAGVVVGHVFSQELVDNYMVKVALSFDEKLQLPVDSSVAIETDGFLGSKHVELTPGADEELLESGDELGYAQDAVLLDELLLKVNSYVEQKKTQEISKEVQ